MAETPAHVWDIDCISCILLNSCTCMGTPSILLQLESEPCLVCL